MPLSTEVIEVLAEQVHLARWAEMRKLGYLDPGTRDCPRCQKRLRQIAGGLLCTSVLCNTVFDTDRRMVGYDKLSDADRGVYRAEARAVVASLEELGVLPCGTL